MQKLFTQFKKFGNLHTFVGLWVCLHMYALAANGPGAGSYEVYVGSAFKIQQLMDSSKWSYVAKNCDGLWWHPVGYQNVAGYDNITPLQWDTLITYFSSKKTLLEGDMSAGTITGDLRMIALTKKLGLTPSDVFVNQIPIDSEAAWIKRVDTNASQGIQSNTMLAPHRMETLSGGFYDTTYHNARQFILDGKGTSVDAPTNLFVHHTEAYRKSIYDAVDFAHKNNRKFLYLISPNVDSNPDTFMTNAQHLVRSLEDSNRIPDFFGVELYGLRPTNLVPESSKDAKGNTVSYGSITGVARWLLKHARADEGELDLWVVGADGKIYGKGNAVNQSALASPVAMNAWTSTNGSFSFTLNLQNNSAVMDFIPELRTTVTGLPALWQIKMTSTGIDITSQMLATNGSHTFSKNERMYPGNTRTVTITLTKAGATTLPSTLNIAVELRPYPRSKFIRDAALLQYVNSSSLSSVAASSSSMKPSSSSVAASSSSVKPSSSSVAASSSSVKPSSASIIASSSSVAISSSAGTVAIRIDAAPTSSHVQLISGTHAEIIPSSIDGTLEVFNIDGKRVLHVQVQAGQDVAPLLYAKSFLIRGLYILRWSVNSASALGNP